MDEPQQHTHAAEPRSSSGCGTAVRRTVILVFVLLIAGGLVFPFTGIYNVAATSGHTAFVSWYLGSMMEHSVRLRAGGIKVPENLNSQNNLDIGFEHYDAMCVMCHGGPGVPRDDIGQGIVPLPPLLTESADDWTAGQVYWIVRHGIKMAGMPAFGPTHSDEKLWAMTAFVKQLPSITAEQYQQLKKTHPAGSEEQQQESE